MAGAKKKRIKVGNVSLPLYQHTEGWRWSWKDPGSGEWRYGTRVNKADAIASATVQAQALASPTAELEAACRDPEQASLLLRVLRAGLTHSDLDRYLLNLAIPEITVNEAIIQFLASKERAMGRSRRNYATLASALKPLQLELGETIITQVRAEHLERWMHRGDPSPRTVQNRRSVVITLWRWARVRGYLPDEPTAAEKTEAPLVPRGTPTTWTPGHLSVMLRACPPSHQTWLATAALAGIRHEELYQADSKSKKDVVRWRDVRGDIIEIRPEVAKTGNRRFIPVCPALRAWFDLVSEAKKPDETLCDGDLPSRQLAGQKHSVTALLGKSVNEPWKSNALRHSFISYRAALVGLATAAMEAGNSESEARRSYHDGKPKAEADAWFNQFPSEVFGSNSDKKS